MMLEPKLLFLMVFVIVYIVLFAVNPSLMLRFSLAAPFYFIVNAIKSFICFLVNDFKHNDLNKLRHYDGSINDFIKDYGIEAYQALLSTKRIKVDLGNYTGLPNYNSSPPPKFKHGGLALKKSRNTSRFKR